MIKLERLIVLPMLLLLAGCPDSVTEEEAENDSGRAVPDTQKVFFSPPGILIREDSEQVTAQKRFFGSPSITFSEAESRVNIDVISDTSDMCPAEVSSCEDWQLSSQGANAGIYFVNAYQQVPRSDGSSREPPGVLSVNVAPADSGSVRVMSLSHAEHLTTLDSNGRIWTRNELQLLAEFGGARADSFTPDFSREARNGNLPNFEQIDSNDFDYGVGIATDGLVYQWGASLARWPEPLSEQPSEFLELNRLVQQAENGARIVQVALPKIDAKQMLTSPNVDSGFGAALMSDGTVIAWSKLSDAGRAFDATVAPVAGIDTATAISLLNDYLIALLNDGTVVEYGRISRSSADEVQINTPTLVGGLQNVVAIAGRRALLADGTVFQWQPTAGGNAISTPVQIPGITNAVALPDARQNIATLIDGRLVGWQFGEDDATPSSAYPIDMPLVGEVLSVARDHVVDVACGRVWKTSLTEHYDEDRDPVAFVPSAEPLIGYGGASLCSNSTLGHVAFIFVTGQGSGTISASNGTVSCNNIVPTGARRLCWWFGNADAQAVFTAVPDEGSSFRDWRWDCASTSTQSAPIADVRVNTEKSQSLCKVTFDAGDDTAPPPDRTLSVLVNGAGSVSSDPGGVDCGSDCSETFADGTTITLTATASTGSVFDNWSDNGCTNNRTMASISISMTNDRTCIANFITAPTGNMPPTASLVTTPQSPVDLGSTVTFDGSPSSDPDGNIVTWEWDFNGDDVNDASGEIVMFTFQTAGNRVIRLRVTDNDGLTAEATGIVDVVSMLSAPPIAAFTIAPDSTAPVGTQFTFDAAPSTDDVGIAGYSWDFENDGSYDASGQVAMFRPPAVGDYDIELRVTDTDGQFVDTLQTITVTPPPTGQFDLIVRLTGPGNVVVVPVGVNLPNSSNCDGDDCFLSGIAAGTTVSLTAGASPPASFVGWSVTECDAIPIESRCEITMNSNRTVTATFQ